MNEIVLTQNVLERFWPKVRVAGDDECWEWMAGRNADGYGTITMGRRGRWRPVRAHRVSWTIAFGAIPDGLWVLHRCDNPPCVNPAHLFLGTNLDNDKDRDAKGRGNPVRGSAHCCAKLSERDVCEIRRELAAREKTQYVIADEFGVTSKAISLIARNKRWSWLQCPPST